MLRSHIILAASLALVAIPLAEQAHAGEMIAVLRPASDSTVPARALASAQQSIQESISTMGNVSMPEYKVAEVVGGSAADCSVDPACLVKAGKELGATRVIGVSMSKDGASYLVTLVMVDVEQGIMVLEALETVASKKVSKGVGPVLESFLRRAPSLSQLATSLSGQAAEEFRLGEYSLALEKYTEANRLDSDPLLLFHIAECHSKLGNHRQAIDIFEGYMTEVPDAANAAEAKVYIEQSRKILKDEERGTEAAKKEKQDAAAANAERQKLLLKREQNLGVKYDEHPIRIWSYIGGAVGLGAAGAGVLFGLKASDDQSAFDDLGCGDAGLPLSGSAVAECNDLRDSGDTNALLTNVFIGTGAALIISAAVLFIVDPGHVERPSSTGARVDVGPGSVVLKLSF